MAKKIVVELIDDTDASKAAETVSFSLDGVSYEIDLSRECGAIALGTLPVGKFCRKVSGARRVASKPTRSTSDAAAIRTWARGKGIEVSDVAAFQPRSARSTLRTSLARRTSNPWS